MKATSYFKTSFFASSVLTLGFSALVLSACNGPSGSSLSAVPVASRQVVHARATPSPIPFKFVTVDDPNSNKNEVTGINQLGKIVGTFGAGSASDIPESYTSQPPYTKFRGLNYPGAEGTDATSLSSNRIVAGYVVNPNQFNGVWAFIRSNGVWSLLKDRKQGEGDYAVTKVLGVNDSEYAVGYYTNVAGVEVPFELNIVTENFNSLQVPGAKSAEATGISGKENLCGTEVLKDKSSEGFYLQNGTYYTLKYPGAVNTWAWGINFYNQIAGQYEDAGGNFHGFILTNPTAGSAVRVWQSIDISGAVSTKLTGINNHQWISGSYVDTAGNTHGFVGMPKS